MPVPNTGDQARTIASAALTATRIDPKTRTDQGVSGASFRCRWCWLLVVLMMGLHFFLAWDLARNQTPTVDEVAHLPAGLSYLDQGTFRMYRHNPPLARLLPSLAASLDAPRLVYDRSWATDEPANHWGFAFETLAANSDTPETRRHYLDAFLRARLVIAAWSTLTIPFLYIWGTWWCGRGTGVVAAALWTISPNILAHASLMTTDIAATSLGLIGAFAFAKWLDRRSWASATWVGLALGTAQLVKFSSLMLYPTFLAWAIVRLFTEPAVRTKRTTVSQLVAIAVMSVVVINLGYGFEGVFRPLGHFPFVSQTLTKPRASIDGPTSTTNNLAYRQILAERINRFWSTPLQELPCPIPEHYIGGFDEQKLEAEGKYPMYLRGQFAQPLPDLQSMLQPNSNTERRGWWYYYLYALAVKVPMGTWLLFVSAIGLSITDALRRRFPNPTSTAIAAQSEQPVPTSLALWLFLASVPILSMSLLTDINLGLRYVLPAMPFIFLVCATVVQVGRSRWLWLLAACALTWNGVSLAKIHSSELSYFNESVGGPENGRHHLIDSNVDWGQDLRNLARWLNRHPEWRDSIRLGYFGSVPPEFEGIDSYRLAPRDLRFVPPERRLPSEDVTDPSTWGPQPGKFAISVNFERGMRFHTPCPIDEFLIRKGKLGGALLGGSQMIEIPRGAYAYFQLLTPQIEPEIGYSILLYDVSLEDANRVRATLGLPRLPPKPGE